MANNYFSGLYPNTSLVGTTALMQRPRYGIDFMGIARGQQIAKDVAWQDRQRALQNLEWQDAEELRNINRAAVEYLAPLANNLQRARAAGQSPSEFLISQQEQMLVDPAYQAFDPRVQTAINANLAAIGRDQVSNLINTGYYEQAEDLANQLGLTGLVQRNLAAVQSGNPQRIVGAAIEQGLAEQRIGANGQTEIRLQGSDIWLPITEAATAIAKNRGAGLGLLTASAAESARQRRMQEQLNLRNQILGRSNTTTPSSNAVEQALNITPSPQALPTADEEKPNVTEATVASGLPPDLTAKWQKIKRARDILNALASQSAAGTYGLGGSDWPTIQALAQRVRTIEENFNDEVEKWRDNRSSGLSTPSGTQASVSDLQQLLNSLGGGN